MLLHTLWIPNFGSCVNSKVWKKPQGGKSWNIFSSLISQKQSPGCLLEFLIWLHVLLMCLSVTSRPNSLAPAFPQGSEQRGHPPALRWVTVPSQLFCQFVSFRTFRVTNTLKKQSVMGANRKYPFLCSGTELFVPSQILPSRKCRANGAVRDESPALRQSFVNNSLGMAQNWKK